MPTLTDALPTINQPNSTEDPKVASALGDIIDLLNGKLDKDNVNPTAGFALAASGGGLKIGLGNSSFNGNGSRVIGFTISHGMGVGPRFAMVLPALATGGGGWVAQFGQTAAGTTSSVFMAALADYGVVFDVGKTFFFNWLTIG